MAKGDMNISIKLTIDEGNPEDALEFGTITMFRDDVLDKIEYYAKQEFGSAQDDFLVELVEDMDNDVIQDCLRDCLYTFFTREARRWEEKHKYDAPEEDVPF